MPISPACPETHRPMAQSDLSMVALTTDLLVSRFHRSVGSAEHIHSRISLLYQRILFQRPFRRTYLKKKTPPGDRFHLQAIQICLVVELAFNKDAVWCFSLDGEPSICLSMCDHTVASYTTLWERKNAVRQHFVFFCFRKWSHSVKETNMKSVNFYSLSMPSLSQVRKQ